MGDNAKIIKDLLALTAGLLYITESEHSFDILDWSDTNNNNQLEQKIAAHSSSLLPVSPIAAGIFFASVIRNAELSGDEAITFASGFRALYAYLQNNFKDIKMYSTGKITVHIYIACNTGYGYIVLHTIGIET